MTHAVWTLDGREELVGRSPVIFRSCPICGGERSSGTNSTGGLDLLRIWAVNHAAECPGRNGRGLSRLFRRAEGPSGGKRSRVSRWKWLMGLAHRK